MPITKAKKVETIEKVQKALDGATSVVFVHFRGLPVAETTALRRSMREQGVGYTVAKKTLIRKALESKKIEGELPALDGEVALAYGDDPILPAKGVAEYAKKYADKISIIGGIFEGRYMSASEMKALSLIPGRETLLGMLVNVWSAPARGLVIALDQISKKQVA